MLNGIEANMQNTFTLTKKKHQIDALRCHFCCAIIINSRLITDAMLVTSCRLLSGQINKNKLNHCPKNDVFH